MQAEITIETYALPRDVPRVCQPDHKYNELFKYDELLVKIELEEEVITDDGAYLSGGEVHQYSNEVGVAYNLLQITEVSSTQNAQFWIDANLLESLETEIRRQLDDGVYDPTPPYEEGDEHFPF